MEWKSKLAGLLLFVSIAYTLPAQTINRYIVFFKDKAGTSYSVSAPSQFLSEKAIVRRAKQGIMITEEDFPVNAAYINQVKATGAKTYFSSRWMNCVLVETSAAIIEQVRLLPTVSRIEFVAPNKKLSSARVKKERNIKETAIAAATISQLQQIGLTEMQADGYRGEGIHIAVFDSGFPGVNTASAFQHIFQEGRLIDSYDFIAQSGNVFKYDEHGTEVLSVIGAYSENTFTGGAYKASFHLYVTEDVGSEYRVEEYNWLFAAERADSAGVDVINSSLGYNTFDDASMDYTQAQLDGKTAVISRAATNAIARGIVVVCSAGNEASNSWQKVTPPADANGILAIGAVTSTGLRSSFSSIGPTADNRIKPDVMAMGSGTSVVRPGGTVSTESGTSVASPLVASLVAGVLQAHPGVTVQDVYRAIVRSASQSTRPDNRYGYGIPDYSGVNEYFAIADYEKEITIYPNPVTNSLVSIAIKHPSNEAIQVMIYNAQGKLVMSTSTVIDWLNNPVRYDLSSLGPGVYIVKVLAGEHMKTMRLVKG